MKNRTTTRIVASVLGFALVCIAGTGCSKPTDKPLREVEHFNMIIVPDLSSRIDNDKPVADMVLLDHILNRIKERDGFICSGNRSTGQKDLFKLELMNNALCSKYNIPVEGIGIDLTKYTKPKALSDYIYRSTENDESLKSDIELMSSQTRAVYKKATGNTDNRGTDIYGYLNGLTSINLKSSDQLKSCESVKNEYRNVIFLLTDGYLEKGDGKDDYRKGSTSLTGQMVKSFREKYLNDRKHHNGKKRSLEQFYLEEGYGIKPLENELLANAEIIVLEISDRSADQAGNTLEPSDEQILHLFWNDWFKRSGVKNWRIQSEVGSLSELDIIIDQVINKQYSEK